jgi:hypothetical protein
MRTTPTWFLFGAVLGLTALQGCETVHPQRTQRALEPIGDLQASYEDFALSLDPQRFTRGYPAVLEMLGSGDRDKRITALRTIAASAELDAIPLVVDVVLNDDDYIARAWAGYALKHIVQLNELKRRDPQHPEKVVILPRSDDDVDLRPLAWVLREMLSKPDDSSAHSCAATMIGYLGLKQFEPDLRGLLESRHPAVTRSAVHALRMMGFALENELDPLRSDDSNPAS